MQPRISLSHKMIVALATVTISVIGIFSYLIIDIERRKLMDEMIRGANQLSETIVSSTRFDMLTFRREDIHRVVETVGRQEGIDKVLIFNKEGTIMFSSDRLDLGLQVNKQTEGCSICHASQVPVVELSPFQRSRVFVDSAGRRMMG